MKGEDIKMKNKDVILWTGADFLVYGGATASYSYGELKPNNED